MAPINHPAVETREPVNRCRCGAGWCPTCGTDHLTEDQEVIGAEIKYFLQPNSTRGGARVVRKKLRSNE